MRLIPKDADLLCTAITVGFLKRALHSAPAHTIVVYEKDEDLEAYTEVAKLLKGINVDMPFQKAVPQAEMPLIIAKPRAYVGSGVLDQYYEVFRQMAQKANALSAPPRGAYVGGLLNVVTPKLSIIGPSGLEIRKPKHREITSAEQTAINSAFNNAVDCTNGALDCVEKLSFRTLKISKTVLDCQNMISKVAKPEGGLKGKLFSSYHGMVQALFTYGPNVAKEQACFELALGRGTTKVASCIPCSIFMDVAGYPATATHLGRGDNWGIPVDRWPIEEWKNQIIEDYRAGRSLIVGRYPQAFMSFDEAHKTDEDTDNSKIPDIFLDALTFEASFTERIIYALDEALYRTLFPRGARLS